MGGINISKIPFSYEKPEPNKIMSFDFTDIEKSIEYLVKDKRLITIAGGGFGGSHYHERIESWVAFGGELELTWMDNAESKSMILNPKNSKDLIVVTVDRNVPHIIRNKSEDNAYLLEWADGKMRNIHTYDFNNTKL